MVLIKFVELSSNRMSRLIFAALLVFLALAFPIAPAFSALQSDESLQDQHDLADSLDAAVDWLVSAHQNSDGGYTSFSMGAGEAGSDISGTLEAVLAIGAAGRNAADPLDYLKSHPEELIAFSEIDGSTAGKVVLALVGAGEEPADYGADFVGILEGHLSEAGDFGVESAFSNSLAILGLDAAGKEIPESALDWLRQHQEVDGDFSGSWDDGFGTAGNPDATALALMALLAGGVGASAEAIESAEDFLAGSQVATGGWEYGQGFGENANSTALVTRALIALGYDPNDGQGPYSPADAAPVEALLTWQGQSGAFQADFGAGPADDFFATVQSIPAISEAQELLTGSDSGIFGGDSVVPYLMLGLVALVFALIVIWYVRARRSGR